MSERRANAAGHLNVRIAQTATSGQAVFCGFPWGSSARGLLTGEHRYVIHKEERRRTAQTPSATLNRPFPGDQTVMALTAKPCYSPTRLLGRLGTVMLLVIPLTLSFFTFEDSAQAKRKRAPSREPDLKILAVTFSHDPYVPGTSPLDLAVEIQLPQDLDGATILEVSSLISSPSKRSVRFLAERKSIETLTGADGAVPSAVEKDPSENPTPHRIAVTLQWDGTDQTKQLVGQGRYHYEVRAKLLAVGENGPRTHMIAWPKRGSLEVKAQIPDGGGTGSANPSGGS